MSATVGGLSASFCRSLAHCIQFTSAVTPIRPFSCGRAVYELHIRSNSSEVIRSRIHCSPNA
eukprot:7287865-Prymnesium_polylepis.1